MFVGGYPSEVMFNLAVQTGQVGDILFTFWLYIVFMLITFLIGCLTQLSHRKGNEELYAYKGQYL